MLKYYLYIGSRVFQATALSSLTGHQLRIFSDAVSDGRFSVDHEYPTSDGFPKKLITIAVEQWAQQDRDTPFIVLLLEHGARMDEVDSATEMAPIHDVVKKGEPKLVREAMKAAVGETDVNVADGEGLTPLHHAVEAIKASIYGIVIHKKN
jgi:hypothetical protein